MNATDYERFVSRLRHELQAEAAASMPLEPGRIQAGAANRRRGRRRRMIQTGAAAAVLAVVLGATALATGPRITRRVAIARANTRFVDGLYERSLLEVAAPQTVALLDTDWFDPPQGVLEF